MQNRQSNKQVFFSLEFLNILLQMEANAVKNASSLLLFSGHSELETGLLSSIKQLNTNMFTNLRTGRVIHFVLEYVKMSKLLLNADFMKKKGNCHEGQKQD